MWGDILTYFTLQSYPEVSRQGDSTGKELRHGLLGHITIWRRLIYLPVSLEVLMETAHLSRPLGLSPYTFLASLLHPLATGIPTLQCSRPIRSQSSSCSSNFVLTLDFLFPLFEIPSPHSFLSFYLAKIQTVFLEKFFHVFSMHFVVFTVECHFFPSTFLFIIVPK